MIWYPAFGTVPTWFSDSFSVPVIRAAIDSTISVSASA